MVFYEEVLNDIEYQSLEEGANSDMRVAMKKYQKEYKDAIKSAKENIKAGKKADAKKDLKKAEAAVDKMEKGIKSIDSNTGDAIVGYYITCLINSAQYLVVAFIPVVNIIGAIAININAIKDLIKSLDENKKENASNAFNFYRSRLLNYCDKLKKEIKSIESKIK